VEKMNRKKQIVYSVVVSIFLSVLSLNAEATVPLDRIVAVVNNDVITESQLDKQVEITKQQMAANQEPIPNDINNKVLHQMIDVKLQLQLAKNANFVASDESVDQAIAMIAKEHNMTVPQLRTALTEQGIQYDKYRKEIQDEVTVGQIQQKQIGPKLVITDQEVAKLAKTLKSSSQKQTVEYHLQAILLAVPEKASPEVVEQKNREAQEVLKKLQAGANMQQLFAATPGLRGGDIGWHKLDDLPPAFAEPIPKMKLGEMFGPIRVPNGFSILQLLASRKAADKPADDSKGTVTEQARQIIYKRKLAEGVDDWLREVRAGAYVKILLNHQS
jgi:peptidyl-prolyl cis-trans isomerase SurA